MMEETGRKFVDIRANLMKLDDIPGIVDRAVTELVESIFWSIMRVLSVVTMRLISQSKTGMT